ncbi:hypothetical protein GCK72_015296 [Caenorhabditis remanei]|uniref:Uncharacterized protein n=1 Tax=Caenorhabditis remanei TaxID=31234 RepID=A0A6A5GW45_CAERE|nr:hypothetical protein GCK72_015296 [Caenorhabditis remanei]KAF1758836.1 hypothetical protein GCK72_015296 [Caenorhabditis remanei]
MASPTSHHLAPTKAPVIIKLSKITSRRLPLFIYSPLGPDMNRHLELVAVFPVMSNNKVQNSFGNPLRGITSQEYKGETPWLMKSTEDIFFLESCDGISIPRTDLRSAQEKDTMMVSRYLGIHCFNDAELIRKPKGQLVEESRVSSELQWTNQFSVKCVTYGDSLESFGSLEESDFGESNTDTPPSDSDDDEDDSDDDTLFGFKLAPASLKVP